MNKPSGSDNIFQLDNWLFVGKPHAMQLVGICKETGKITKTSTVLGGYFTKKEIIVKTEKRTFKLGNPCEKWVAMFAGVEAIFLENLSAINSGLWFNFNQEQGLKSLEDHLTVLNKKGIISDSELKEVLNAC